MTDTQAVLLLLCSEEWKQELISLLDSQSETNTSRTRRRRKQKESEHNLTAQYIEREYESLSKGLHNLTYGKTLNEGKDFVQGFLADLIRKDTLSPKLSQGESIKFSVLASWFNQYMTRKWQYFGKDASTRTFTGARSQLEVKTGQSHVWEDPNPAKVVVLTDDQGGDGIKDFDVDQESCGTEAEKKIFAEDLSRIVKATLLENSSERAEHLFRVFEARRDESFKTKREWARQWGITASQLDRDISEVEGAIFSLGREYFGI